MSEQRFGWNYFENEVVIGDKQDKKRMIVIVLSNFMDIPYNKKSFDELVDWLNEQQATITELERKLNKYAKIGEEQLKQIMELQDLCGQSDSENARLRLKSKELQEEIKLLKPTNIEQYEQIVQLQEENEQLKNRLNNGFIKECSL